MIVSYLPPGVHLGLVLGKYIVDTEHSISALLIQMFREVGLGLGHGGEYVNTARPDSRTASARIACIAFGSAQQLNLFGLPE